MVHAEKQHEDNRLLLGRGKPAAGGPTGWGSGKHAAWVPYPAKYLSNTKGGASKCIRGSTKTEKIYY